MAPNESGANHVGADEKMVEGRTWAVGVEIAVGQEVVREGESLMGKEEETLQSKVTCDQER